MTEPKKYQFQLSQRKVGHFFFTTISPKKVGHFFQQGSASHPAVTYCFKMVKTRWTSRLESLPKQVEDDYKLLTKLAAKTVSNLFPEDDDTLPILKELENLTKSVILCLKGETTTNVNADLESFMSVFFTRESVLTEFDENYSLDLECSRRKKKFENELIIRNIASCIVDRIMV